MSREDELKARLSVVLGEIADLAKQLQDKACELREIAFELESDDCDRFAINDAIRALCKGK